MQLKLNQDLRTPYGFKKKGDVVDVVVDNENIPVDLFWRNRVKDSAIDNCVEFVELETKKKNK